MYFLSHREYLLPPKFKEYTQLEWTNILLEWNYRKCRFGYFGSQISMDLSLKINILFQEQ